MKNGSFVIKHYDFAKARTRLPTRFTAFAAEGRTGTKTTVKAITATQTAYAGKQENLAPHSENRTSAPQVAGQNHLSKICIILPKSRVNWRILRGELKIKLSKKAIITAFTEQAILSATLIALPLHAPNNGKRISEEIHNALTTNSRRLSPASPSTGEKSEQAD